MIFECLSEINEDRDEARKIALDPSTRLLGERGELDSLDIVNLVVCLESRLGDRVNQPVVLVTEDVLSGATRAFRDVSSLAEHALRVAGAAQ